MSVQRLDPEACASCDEPTAAGRPLFPGRRVITDEEARRFINSGSMAAIHWNGGIGGGIGPF